MSDGVISINITKAFHVIQKFEFLFIDLVLKVTFPCANSLVFVASF
jgi:hypothetical protein